LSGFIGINQHHDPRIRELTGARRDATALWALFSDSIPDLQTRLLVDEEATVEAIRELLNDTLTRATTDDVVVLTFSGHGTRDHRLVAHNTLLDSLPDTTLSMEELARRFKDSKAKCVVCILDCCFSGGAPARVLEDSPAPREPGSPLADIAGKGR